MPVARPLPAEFIDMPRATVHFDTGAFDHLLRSHPTRFVHYRAMRCPVGLVSPHDQQQPHEDHAGCSNGFVFTRAGVLLGVWSSNSKEKRAEAAGMLDVSSALITFPRTYEETGEEVFLAEFDRLFLEDEHILVPFWETVQANLSGQDRLSRPAVRVVDLMDNRGARYTEEVDFVLRDGRVRWTGRRPAYDPMAGTSPVYTVRYLFRPFFIVDQLLHELRIAHEKDPNGGLRTVRMPQQVRVVREYIHLGSQRQDPMATGGDGSRQAEPPADGGFGPQERLPA